MGDPNTVTDALTDVVAQVGPASAVDTFKGPIEGLTESSGAAGILLIVGIASALWTASGYVGAFMRAANRIYEVHLVQPHDDPDTWVMLEMFRSRAAWDEHMRQPYNTEGNKILEELLREPSDLRLFNEK